MMRSCIAIIGVLLAGMILFGCTQPSTDEIPFLNQTTKPTVNISKNMTPVNATIKTCTDGTKLKNCSANKPYYCQANGTLTKSPVQCGCPANQTRVKNVCFKDCADSTKHGACSTTLPKYCYNGTLSDNATKCGCFSNATKSGNLCMLKNCSDGTLYGNCSASKPFFCSNGTLTQNISLCGCASGLSATGGYCLGPLGCWEGWLYFDTLKNNTRSLRDIKLDPGGVGKVTNVGGGDEYKLTWANITSSMLNITFRINSSTVTSAIAYYQYNQGVETLVIGTIATGTFSKVRCG